MSDSINEVGKLLKKTKKNSEAALRRYALIHPRVERIRDIFDDTVSFEMEFETNPHDKLMGMDLFFNKPPPLKNCKFGRYKLSCLEFILDSGDHLINIGRYQAGTISVFLNGVQLSASQFSEYDPMNGLIYVTGGSGTQTYNTCFVSDTWVSCSTHVDLTYSSFSETYQHIDGPIERPPLFSDYGVSWDLSAETQTGNEFGATKIFQFFFDPVPVSNIRVEFDAVIEMQRDDLTGAIDPDGDQNAGILMTGTGVGIQLIDRRVYWHTPVEFVFRNLYSDFTQSRFVNLSGDGASIGYAPDGDFFSSSVTWSVDLHSLTGHYSVDINEGRGTAILQSPLGSIEQYLTSSSSDTVSSLSFAVTINSRNVGPTSSFMRAQVSGVTVTCSLEASSG